VRDSFTTAADVSENSVWQLTGEPDSRPGLASTQSTANVREPAATSNFLTAMSILGTDASLCRTLSNTMIPYWCCKRITQSAAQLIAERRDATTAVDSQSRVISPDQYLRRIDTCV
jgi:hypothetical protein